MSQQISIVQVKQWVNELDQSLAMIIDEEEQSYIQGVKMMVEMDEPISVQTANKIKDIYVKFRQLQHSSV